MDTARIQINGQFFNSEEIQHKVQTEDLPGWEKGIYEFILNWFDWPDFIHQQTSGSTGTPKEIRLKKSAMVSSATKTINYFKLKENDTAWLCLPINYIAGKMMVVRAIVGKLNLIITEPEGTPQIPDSTIEFTAMVPLQVQKLVDSNANFELVQKLIIGGAATNNALLDKIQKLSTEIYATYGMTETCSHIALQRLNGPSPDQYFHLLPGISISTNDENCLKIYAPELSFEVLQTSDVVQLFSAKEFKIIGRADNIINSGSLKISPEELENRIASIINRECLIIPKKDPLLGQKLVLIIEGVEDKTLAATLLEKIKFGIGRHKSPKHLRFIEQFPRNASMKIDRQKVMEQLNINL